MISWSFLMKNYINYSLDLESKYPTICSLYTPNWEYPAFAEKLAKNCEELNLNYNICGYEDTGSYLRNCRLKPNHIQSVMEDLNRPLLWIDVDGSIYKKPEIFVNTEKDFMAKKMPVNRVRYWHVGTMFFNNTHMGKNFLKAWVEKTNTISGSDELALDLLWNEGEFEKCLSFSDIPVYYFRIKNRKYSPNTKDVIIHRISRGEDKLKLKKTNKLA